MAKEIEDWRIGAHLAPWGDDVWVLDPSIGRKSTALAKQGGGNDVVEQLFSLGSGNLASLSRLNALFIYIPRQIDLLIRGRLDRRVLLLNTPASIVQ